MAVNHIIEWLSRDLVPDNRHSLVSSAVYTAPPFFAESFPDRSNRSLPRFLLRLHTEGIIPTFLTLNSYIGQCLTKSLTLPRLRP